MNILILDDDEIRHMAFKKNLFGHNLLHTYTAQECIFALDIKGPWDVVFLDHDLGGKTLVKSGKETGFEVAQWLKENENKQPPQIIVHSFNPVGATNMCNLLPKAVRAPGIWSRQDVLYSKIERK